MQILKNDNSQIFNYIYIIHILYILYNINVIILLLLQLYKYEWKNYINKNND